MFVRTLHLFLKTLLAFPILLMKLGLLAYIKELYHFLRISCNPYMLLNIILAQS